MQAALAAPSPSTAGFSLLCSVPLYVPADATALLSDVLPGAVSLVEAMLRAVGCTFLTVRIRFSRVSRVNACSHRVPILHPCVSCAIANGRAFLDYFANDGRPRAQTSLRATLHGSLADDVRPLHELCVSDLYSSAGQVLVDLAPEAAAGAGLAVPAGWRAHVRPHADTGEGGRSRLALELEASQAARRRLQASLDARDAEMQSLRVAHTDSVEAVHRMLARSQLDARSLRDQLVEKDRELSVVVSERDALLLRLAELEARLTQSNRGADAPTPSAPATLSLATRPVPGSARADAADPIEVLSEHDMQSKVSALEAESRDMTAAWEAMRAEMEAMQSVMETELRNELQVELEAHQSDFVSSLQEHVIVHLELFRGEQQRIKDDVAAHFRDQSTGIEGRVRQMEMVAERLERDVSLLLDGIRSANETWPIRA